MVGPLLDNSRSAVDYKMALEDFNFEETRSFEDNTYHTPEEEVASLESITSSTPGGAVSFLPSVEPPGDLIIVTER